MDIQAKLAARRAELASEEVGNQEVAHARAAEIELRLGQIETEIRLDAKNDVKYVLDSIRDSNGNDIKIDEMTKKEVRRFIKNKSVKMFTESENRTLYMLFIFGIIVCIFWSWHGLWFILSSSMYTLYIRNKYQVILEKKISELRP